VVTGVVYRHLGPEADAVPSERSARAHLTIVCDGMYSSLRKHLSQPKVRP
jgi:squalene monooxygenase